MRKHQQRAAYVPATPTTTTKAKTKTTTSHDMLYGEQQQQRDDSQRNGIQQISFEDETLLSYDVHPHPHPQPHMTMAEPQYIQNWQHTSDGISAKNTQEALLDFNNNNNSNSSKNLATPPAAPTTTTPTTRLHKRATWQNPKQYRSCNNLSSIDCGSADSSGAGSTFSAEFHHMDMWRQNIDNPDEARDSDLYDARLQSAGENHSHNQNNRCNIGNCGKILWISREPQAQQHGWQQQSDMRTQIGMGTATSYAPMPGIIVRTNAQGLPYTPSPHQRQAYLANQHAIEAAIPLVVNGVGAGRRTKSPNRYFESDVNIHYKTPIRYEYKEAIPEEELAFRQAEQMQKLYQEERRRKYLQELQDMNSRRHTDNFTPSQKSPIPLNRYDDFQSDLAPKSPNTVLLTKTIARALYNFQGQTARELTFRKGDVIYIRRQIDKNWYEGEHNAMIGLLPANYVEIISRDGVRQPIRKPSEGQARAKYNFQAQSGIELSLNKGELVTLTRRVDKNWFEGKIANRKGIFPVCYVEVLSDIGTDDYSAPRTVMTSSGLRPSLDTLRTSINNEFNTITQNGHQPPNGILRETRNMQKTDVLHVDTSTNPIAYRALYKYRPQNSDELELLEGDLVHVLEKCDDGWFVGTSQRTGCFGTFPGNYVERA